ncbi:MAG: ADP-forming succinate--CoA ligase subunit beta [Actinomycetota bacterium]
MDLLEHEGKELLRRWGVPVPDGRVAAGPDEAAATASALGAPVVVKAQVPIGGRGKAGGIRRASTPDEAAAAAAAILNMEIRGHRVERVLVEPASDIAAELYAAVTLDRSAGRPLVILSTRGGMDIEEVAAAEPEAIARVPADPLIGLGDFQVRKLLFAAGVPAEARDGVAMLLRALYRVFVEADAGLVEVNPLVLTRDGRVLALDAKVSIDDSALFRHPELEHVRRRPSRDPQERAAAERGLNFIKLDGSVGIIGNGAGLVMATLDLVALAGGRAANFLDVGGGAGAEVLAASLEVILSDPAVRAVLVNIFGGITRCDLVATGIVQALGHVEVRVPIVVRLDGTNADEGRHILATHEHPMLATAETMVDAARQAVEAAA